MLEQLRALRLDPEGLRARFDTPTPGEAETRLIQRWRARAQAGRDWGLTHYRLYHAIDRAWDSDFYQASHTLIGAIREISEQRNETAALEVARKWKMTHLITRAKDPKTGMPVGAERLHIPTLYEIVLALPRNYTLMRVSRIVTERLQVPLFKFEPAMATDSNRLRTEIVTQRVDSMSRDFSYGATLDQAVTYAGMYGHQLQFIAEEWFETSSLDGSIDKEGLRYNLPHPSRCYFDLDFPLWTLNTGTGCRYAGYWQVTTYGNLRHTNYWNLERIKYNSGSLNSPEWQLYFQTTGQCRMASGFNTYDVGGTLDRQTIVDGQFYCQSHDSVPVWTTEHFELINLRDFDPAFPDVNLWFRVVLASDDTPIYVAALPGRPVTTWLWEPTDNRAIQAGMMLATMPFGDHCSNLLTQGILSTKQNLANVTLYDSDVVDPASVRQDIENPNEVFYRKLNFWPFSGRKLQKQQASLDQVFKSYRFPPQSVADHLTLINQLLAMLERVLGMSAQEVGSYASHEQSAEEVRTIHTATGHRFEHIASWVDRSIEAWKSQLYTYLMANGKLAAYAYVAPELAQMAKAAQFQIIEGGPRGVQVSAPVGALRVEMFTAQRDGPNRVPWTQIGQQMVQLVQTFLAGPTSQLFGAENLVKMINMSLEAMGLPRSFRLDPAAAAQAQPQGEDFKAYLQQQLTALAEQTKQYVDQSQQQLIASLAQAAGATASVEPQ